MNEENEYSPGCAKNHDNYITTTQAFIMINDAIKPIMRELNVLSLNNKYPQSKRDRLEDIGRLREKIEKVLDEEIFQEFKGIYRKNVKEDLMNLINSRHDFLEEMYYQMKRIEEMLWECYAICKGDEDE